MLNLHANKLQRLSQVSQLAGLAKLRKLTLFGNDALQAQRGYRLAVIRAIPQLKSLDDNVITQEERTQARLHH